MTVSILGSWRKGLDAEAGGRWLLVAAAVLVGIAILASGSAAKGVNGVAGVLWFVAAGILVASLRRARHRNLALVVVMVVTLTLVVLVKPSDVLWAVIGFSVAGAVVAFLFSGRPLGWAILVPALWLPCHLLVAGSRAAYQELANGTTHIRTNPPPTAAIVPLVMVLAAWLGAVVATRLMAARASRRRHAAPVPSDRRGVAAESPQLPAK